MKFRTKTGARPARLNSSGRGKASVQTASSQRAERSPELVRAGARCRIRPQLQIVPAVSRVQVSQARQLFEEYAGAIGISLCFQNFGEELAGLPGRYATPTGALFLAGCDGKVAGCAALRRLKPGVCEMKRLYVRPQYRGKQIGRALARMIIDEAGRLGYGTIVLDTLPGMRAAITLYESLGFRRIKPYNANPVEGVIYMKLALKSSLSPKTRANGLRKRKCTQMKTRRAGKR